MTYTTYVNNPDIHRDISSLGCYLARHMCVMPDICPDTHSYVWFILRSCQIVYTYIRAGNTYIVITLMCLSKWKFIIQKSDICLGCRVIYHTMSIYDVPFYSYICNWLCLYVSPRHVSCIPDIRAVIRHLILQMVGHVRFLYLSLALFPPLLCTHLCSCLPS